MEGYLREGYLREGYLRIPLNTPTYRRFQVRGQVAIENFFKIFCFLWRETSIFKKNFLKFLALLKIKGSSFQKKFF